MTVSIIKTEAANEVYGIEQLKAIPETERTPAQREALLLHDRLAYDKQMVEVGIVSMCRDLKEIRDGKHYETLGFGDFGEYTEQMHGIGARQAYNYIPVYEKLGVEILNSNSKIGVTKLLELASLEPEERQELLAAHPVEELEEMSTAEVKRLTAEVKRLEEQLSMFEQDADEKSNTESALRDEIEAELRDEYDARMKSEKASANAETIRLQTELKQVRSELKMNNEAIKRAEARAKQAEEAAAHAIELENKVKAAEAEKTEIEKKIKLSVDPELTRFKYMFEMWQSVTSTLFDQLDRLDSDKQDKMRAAVKAVMGDRL